MKCKWHIPEEPGCNGVNCDCNELVQIELPLKIVRLIIEVLKIAVDLGKNKHKSND
jgi:hypothetical protein